MHLLVGVGTVVHQSLNESVNTESGTQTLMILTFGISAGTVSMRPFTDATAVVGEGTLEDDFPEIEEAEIVTICRWADGSISVRHDLDLDVAISLLTQATFVVAMPEGIEDEDESDG